MDKEVEKVSVYNDNTFLALFDNFIPDFKLFTTGAHLLYELTTGYSPSFNFSIRCSVIV